MDIHLYHELNILLPCQIPTCKSIIFVLDVHSTQKNSRDFLHTKLQQFPERPFSGMSKPWFYAYEIQIKYVRNWHNFGQCDPNRYIVSDNSISVLLKLKLPGSIIFCAGVGLWSVDTTISIAVGFKVRN